MVKHLYYRKSEGFEGEHCALCWCRMHIHLFGKRQIIKKDNLLDEGEYFWKED